MAIVTLSAGILAITTSQKRRRLFVPLPRSAAHVATDDTFGGAAARCAGRTAAAIVARITIRGHERRIGIEYNGRDVSVSRAHCLSDGRNDGDALSAWRRRPRCRRVWLHRAPARGAAEAESLGVHQRPLRQDRGAAPGSDSRVLRSA